MTRVTPNQIENDPRFAAILGADHGIPSSESEAGSVAIAHLINWWRSCIEGGEQVNNLLNDIGSLVNVLKGFESLVRHDSSVVTEDAGKETAQDEKPSKFDLAKQRDDYLFAAAVDGLREYHPRLNSKEVCEAMREMVAIENSGNNQQDYEKLRDEVEWWLNRLH